MKDLGGAGNGNFVFVFPPSGKSRMDLFGGSLTFEVGKTMAAMTIHDLVEKSNLVFSNKDTDMLITWDGGIVFEVYAGRFDGSYDCIDSFYQKVSDINAARACADLWYREHSRFNPGL